METLYAELGIVQDDKEMLASKRHWLLSQGFGCFLACFTKCPNFNILWRGLIKHIGTWGTRRG
ncbi:hypothetical protein Hanom_Chr07g00642221 [Helianthus anomalus]